MNEGMILFLYNIKDILFGIDISTDYILDFIKSRFNSSTKVLFESVFRCNSEGSILFNASEIVDADEIESEMSFQSMCDLIKRLSIEKVDRIAILSSMFGDFLREYFEISSNSKRVRVKS